MGSGDREGDADEHKREGITICNKLSNGNGGEKDGVKVKGGQKRIPRKKNANAEEEEGRQEDKIMRRVEGRSGVSRGRG